MKKIDLMLIKNYFRSIVVILCVVSFVMYTINAVQWAKDIAGKNIGLTNFLKMVTYLVGMSFTLIGVPIATLLASVINMKELVENKEIIAIHNTGASELRILSPLILINVIMACLMYYGNAFLTPKANEKFSRLLLNIKRTNPMIDIKEGVFYNGLEGYSLKVNKKSMDEKTIEDIIIYDHTEKKGNVIASIAKSGNIYITPSEKYFIMTLHHGYSYIDSSKIENNESEKARFIRNNFKRQRIILDAKDLGLNIKDTFKKSLFYMNGLKIEKEIIKFRIAKNDLFLKKIKDTVHFLTNFSNLYMTKPTSLDENYDVDEKENKIVLIHKILGSPKKINIIQNAKKKIMTFQNKLDNNIVKFEILGNKIGKYRIQHLSYLMQSIAVILLVILGSALGIISRKGEIKLQSVILVLIFLIYYFLIYRAIYLSQNTILRPEIAILMPFSFILITTIYFSNKALKGDSIKLEDLKYFLRKKFFFLQRNRK